MKAQHKQINLDINGDNLIKLPPPDKFKREFNYSASPKSLISISFPSDDDPLAFFKVSPTIIILDFSALPYTFSNFIIGLKST